MTTRLQVLRSSTSGNLPAAGTRLPGELWANFPDLQLGVIDAARNAQKLVAVRYFSTTANYAAGDFVIQAGVLYAAKGAITAGAFNPAQWTQIGAATDLGGPYLPVAGGTLTGALILAADPGAALGAATKQYVDGKVTAAPFLPIAGGTLTGKLTLAGPPSAALDAVTKAYVDAGAFVPVGGGANTGLNDNRVINGDMRIDQRNAGASGTANGYTVDRWLYTSTQASKIQWQRQIGGFPYCLTFSTAAAFTPAASDYFMILQPIEADMISDFAWGTLNAQPATLSFWAQANITGTYSGSIRNSPATRSFPFSFTLPANLWTKVVINIPGDTAGTWAMYGNLTGIQLSFDLGSGSTFRAAAGAWQAGNFLGVTGAVNAVAGSTIFYLASVKLEIGSVATPFNRQSLAKSMADCQRYYFGGVFTGSGYIGVAGGFLGWSWALPVSMRAAPTVTPTFGTQTNVTSPAANLAAATAVGFGGTATAAGNWVLSGSYTAAAEL